MSTHKFVPGVKLFQIPFIQPGSCVVECVALRQWNTLITLPSFTLSQSHYGTRSPDTVDLRSGNVRVKGRKKKMILDSRSTASCLVSERGVSVFVAVICFPFADGTVRMSENRKCSNLQQLSNSNTVRARNRFAALCSITVD